MFDPGTETEITELESALQQAHDIIADALGGDCCGEDSDNDNPGSDEEE